MKSLIDHRGLSGDPRLTELTCPRCATKGYLDWDHYYPTAPVRWIECFNCAWESEQAQTEDEVIRIFKETFK